jgi:hypothetical protein
MAMEKGATKAFCVGKHKSYPVSLKKSAFGADDANAVAPMALSILALPFPTSGRWDGVTMVYVGPPRARGLGIRPDAPSAAISAGVGLDYQ